MMTSQINEDLFARAVEMAKPRNRKAKDRARYLITEAYLAMPIPTEPSSWPPASLLREANDIVDLYDQLMEELDGTYLE